ncbi:MAG: stage V sporulation protein AD [Ruminococcaceae bacterium]|nr:stage V sporulation protein AD [Oscillospiraceae bacterium]
MATLNFNTIEFEKMPCVEGYASVTGSKEKEGPLGELFDFCDIDNTFGQDTWEKSESVMQQKVCCIAMDKLKLKPENIDFIFAGDLLNQCISSSYGLRDFNIKFFGLYGACSTMAEGMILSALTVDSGVAKRTINLSSSHFCSAERQFRFPLEYGSQRPPSAQWTVTGAGAVIMGERGKVKVKRATVGKIKDLGVDDINNMGAAMAPAAAQTLIEFFNDTKTIPSDYDFIATGDLGYVGYDIVKDLCKKEGYDLNNNYTDCGLIIYDREAQDVHAGGSGCGCSASVLTSYILPKMERGELKKVLFIGTGALMSPVSFQQGESIPSIAHLVELSAE